MIAATRWLDALRSQLAEAARRGAPEDIHDLRVATRRLSSWLWLGGVSVLRSDLKWLRGVAGAVRDADVVLAMGPEPDWARGLDVERAAHYRALVSAIDSERVPALLLALECMPAVPNARARRALERLAARALGRGRGFERAPEDVEAFHALRRAVRSLRYALEWLDQKTGAFREFQDTSGLAADQALALRMLDAYPGAESLTGRRRALEAEFVAHRQGTLAAWPALKQRIAAIS
jgi:CHAD domain-containing protein